VSPFRLQLLAALAVVLSAGLVPRLRGQPAPQSHLEFRAAAHEAYQRKDFAAALSATREALKLRPDSPRYLHNLAALHALTGNPAAAIDHLRRLAALGVHTDVARDPDLAPLQGTAEFAEVIGLLSANLEPRGTLGDFATLPGRTGILEGIAYRERTGELFLGDVHHRCIWRRTRDGELARFTAADADIAGIFAVTVDEERQTLWATMAAVPQMEGYEPEMKGFTAVAEFDLRTGELRHISPVADDGREHLLGDLTLAPDGTLYATDSRSPILWQVAPGAEEPTRLLDLPGHQSLQGIALVGRRIIVSDYSNGLLVVDLGNRQVAPLAPPENTTLLGIDGLTPIPGGVVATQNGTSPQRILRIALSPDLDRIAEVQVLASGHPALTDLSLITLVQDRPTFIAGSGWDALEGTRARAPAAHAVRLLQVEPQ
jgi:hypothetical protein